MQTIVIGHRNPDMDSICSAVAYAELKRLTGQEDVLAARAGNTNERIDFVLGKFGVEAPMLLNDLSPRVADVMQPRVISVRADSPVYDALQLIDKKQMRGLPVAMACRIRKISSTAPATRLPATTSCRSHSKCQRVSSRAREQTRLISRHCRLPTIQDTAH